MADRLIDFFQRVYVGLTFAFIFLPIITLAVFSFNVDQFPSLPWKGFGTIWYSAVFADRSIIDAFRNSILVGLAAASVSTGLGFAAAYFDTRWNFTGKKIYLVIAVLPPTVPLLILALALLMFLSRLGLSGTLTAVFISHVVICTPFAMAIIRLRLADMDRELEESAWNLGASQLQAVRRVILPFAAPGIAAAFMITLAVSFDEFMIAWFVSGLDVTLPVKILALLQGQVSPRINAIGTLVFSVTIVLVGLAQLILILWKPERSRADVVATEG